MDNNYGLIPGATKSEVTTAYKMLMNVAKLGKEKSLYEICKEYDLYYDNELAQNSCGIQEYIKYLSSLKQYKDKAFRHTLKSNSVLDKTPQYIGTFVRPAENNIGIKQELSSSKELSVLNVLKQDRDSIIKKMGIALHSDNIGTYNNLVKSLVLVSDLINKEDLKWVQMWTKYTVENGDLELAVWEQCGDDIRNHRRFLVEKEIKDDVEEIVDKAKSLLYQIDIGNLTDGNDHNFLMNQSLIDFRNSIDKAMLCEK